MLFYFFAILHSQNLNLLSILWIEGCSHTQEKQNLQQGLFRCQSFISLFVWSPCAERWVQEHNVCLRHVSQVSSAKINNCQGSGCTIRSDASSEQTLTVCLCTTSPLLNREITNDLQPKLSFQCTC